MNTYKVNDWVCYNGKAYQIKRIKESGYIELFKLEGNLEISSIKPILVNPKFLKDIIGNPKFLDEKLKVRKGKWRGLDLEYDEKQEISSIVSFVFIMYTNYNIYLSI